MAELLAASPEFVVDIAAGSAGGFMSKALDYPFDTAKVLLQTQSSSSSNGGSSSAAAKTPKYTGTFDCLQQSVKQKGFISLYNGISSRLVGSMAENAVCFLAYAGIKRELLQYKQQQQQQQQGKSKDTQEETPVKLTLFDMSIAGAGSGAAVSFIMTPVELIKCRMQVSSQLPTPLYQSSWDCLVKTVQHGGLSGLYKGHMSTMYREVPGNFCWYLTYEVVCEALAPLLDTPRDELSVRAHMAGGAAAGVMYWAAIFPVDTVKSVLQTQTPAPSEGVLATQNLSFRQALQTIYKEQGLRGLYRGFGVTAVRAAPANAVLFAGYEQTSQFLKNQAS